MPAVNPTTTTLPTPVVLTQPTPAPRVDPFVTALAAAGGTRESAIEALKASGATASQEWDFGRTLSAAATSFVSVAQDEAYYTGIYRPSADGQGGSPNLATLMGIGAGATGASVVEALIRGTGSTDAGVGSTLRETARDSARLLGVNGLRVTPMLISAVLGPAIADGITLLAPTKMIKYKTLVGVTDPKKKAEIEADNAKVKIQRWVVGAAAVGGAAALMFLWKPQWFPKDAVVFHASENAIKGFTELTLVKGVAGAARSVTRHTLTGVLSEKAALDLIAKQTPGLVEGAKATVKTFAPLARSAVATNRIMFGIAGGIGGLMVADKFGRDSGGFWEKNATLLGGAALGAAALGGVGGLLATRSMAKNGGLGGTLANLDFLHGPNKQWFKDYASRVLPVTGIPAGLAASQYFNIVSDIFTITDARSPFRK